MKQSGKFWKDNYTTKGCGDWFATANRRFAKLRASHIDLDAPYDNGDI
jgi:hypothetical protein